MPALASSFKTEVSALIANEDFAALKAKLAPWLPADARPPFLTGLIIYFSVAIVSMRGTLL